MIWFPVWVHYTEASARCVHVGCFCSWKRCEKTLGKRLRLRSTDVSSFVFVCVYKGVCVCSLTGDQLERRQTAKSMARLECCLHFWRVVCTFERPCQDTSRRMEASFKCLTQRIVMVIVLQLLSLGGTLPSTTWHFHNSASCCILKVPCYTDFGCVFSIVWTPVEQSCVINCQ